MHYGRAPDHHHLPTTAAGGNDESEACAGLEPAASPGKTLVMRNAPLTYPR